MKSLAVTKDYKLSVVDLPMPEIGDDCVLTRTLACGVCNGTDTKILHGDFKGITEYPCLLGHEAVGEVIQVGRLVKRFKVGDHVLVPFLELDEQRQYHGYYSFWGGYSQYTVARDYQAMAAAGIGEGHPEFWDAYYTQQVLPPDIDPVDGVMIITFCEVLAAIRNFGFKPGSSIVVFGAGPVGLTFIRLMKLAGIGTVIAADIKADKRAEALAAGADHFIDSSDGELTAAVRAIVPAGCDYVLDAVGVNQVINQAMYLLKENGQICVYGISAKMEMDLSWQEAPYNWSLKFLHMPVKEEQAAALEQIIKWVRSGEIVLADYISHRLPFAEVEQAFLMIADKVSTKKIVITYD